MLPVSWSKNKFGAYYESYYIYSMKISIATFVIDFKKETYYVT